jgi:hypothetical protein
MTGEMCAALLSHNGQDWPYYGDEAKTSVSNCARISLKLVFSTIPRLTVFGAVGPRIDAAEPLKCGPHYRFDLLLEGTGRN